MLKLYLDNGQKGDFNMIGNEQNNVSQEFQNNFPQDYWNLYCIEDDLTTLESNQYSEQSNSEQIDNLLQYLPCNTTMLPLKTRRSQRITLVLDLDETLIRSSFVQTDNYDFNTSFTYEKQVQEVYVKLRPYLLPFLKVAGKLFELVIFTASEKSYADSILNYIDPAGEFIRYRLYRNSCTVVNGSYLKDLRILNRDLKETIIVDNQLESFILHENNGILIQSWFGDEADVELLKTLETLLTIMDVPDVREILSTSY